MSKLSRKTPTCLASGSHMPISPKLAMYSSTDVEVAAGVCREAGFCCWAVPSQPTQHKLKIAKRPSVLMFCPITTALTRRRPINLVFTNRVVHPFGASSNSHLLFCVVVLRTIDEGSVLRVEYFKVPFPMWSCLGETLPNPINRMQTYISLKLQSCIMVESNQFVKSNV